MLLQSVLGLIDEITKKAVKCYLTENSEHKAEK